MIYLNGKEYGMLRLDVGLQGGDPVLQEKTATPSEQTQQVTPSSGYDGLSKVTINPISSTYVGSGIARKSSSDLSVSGATVTAPAGYYASAASKSVANGSVAVNTPTVSASGLITASARVTAGYISGNPSNATLQMTTKGAATYTPSTTNQTIASGQYLTGVQTIAGDADLVARNIKKGVNIFGVTGTYEGGGGGGESYSIVPSTQTFYHNQYVTLGIDIAADGTFSVYKDSGGGTVTNPKVSTSMSTTFDPSSIITSLDIPQTEGDYTLPIVVWWDNTSGQNNDHTSVTNPWVLEYTVISSGGGTITTEPLTVTANGTYTAPTGKAYTPVTVNVSGGGSGNIDTKTVTPSANATSVQITGMKGTPKWFFFTPNSNISGASNSRRIVNHIYDGTSDIGFNLYGSGSYGATYSVQRNTTNFSHTYSGTTLTLNSGASNTGGVYQNVQYTLVYGY